MSFTGSLTLLMPLGLLGLLGLIIPVLIHLFSRSRGRLVHVANLQLYRQAKQRRVNELRLSQWLLLLLRLALLAVAVLLLAGLAIPGSSSLSGSTAYVTPGWVSAQEESPDAGLDSQLQGHEQMFLLRSDFPTWAPNEATSVQSPQNKGSLNGNWSLLAERLGSVLHRGEVHIYSTADEWGPRPAALPLQPDWHTLEAPAEQPPQQFEVTVLFDPARQGDARIVEAALQALRDHRSGSVGNIRTLPIAGNQWPSEVLWRTTDAGNAHPVVIWLGLDAAPESLPDDLPSSITLLSDQLPDTDAFVMTARLPHYPDQVWQGRMNRSEEPTEANQKVLWRSEQGLVLLLETRIGSVRRLDLTSGLSSSSGDWLDQSGFPDTLLYFMLGDRGWKNAFSMSIQPPELAPVLTPDVEVTGPKRSLGPWLAVLLVLLWCAERWFCERRAIHGDDKLRSGV